MTGYDGCGGSVIPLRRFHDLGENPSHVARVDEDGFLEIVDRINADLYTVSAMPEVVERLAALGGTPKLMRPAEFAAFASAEKERWGQIIRRANIKVE